MSSLSHYPTTQPSKKLTVYYYFQETRLTIKADLVVKDDVSWSDVKMEDVPVVYEAHTGHDLLDEHPALVLCQLVLRVRQSLKQVPT